MQAAQDYVQQKEMKIWHRTLSFLHESQLEQTLTQQQWDPTFIIHQSNISESIFLYSSLQ